MTTVDKRGIVARLRDRNALAALKTYLQGRGMPGKKTWELVSQIVDALDAAFVKRHDGAGLRHGLLVMPRASAAMALVTAATEP